MYGGGIVYESSNGTITKCNQHYQQNMEVPHVIKEKLHQLPSIVKHLFQPKHKNIR